MIGSLGFHSWLQMQYALGLSLARHGEEGSVLGRVSSVGFAGRMLGMVAVLVVLLLVGQLAETPDEWQGPIFRGAVHRRRRLRPSSARSRFCAFRCRPTTRRHGARARQS